MPYCFHDLDPVSFSLRLSIYSPPPSQSFGTPVCPATSDFHDIGYRLVLAAPAGSDSSATTLSHSRTTHATSNTRSVSETSRSRTHTRAPAGDADDDVRTATHRPSDTSTSHSLLILPTSHHPLPHSTWTQSHTRSIPHHPRPTTPLAAPQSSSPPSRGQSGVAIAFEVLGGALALILLITLGRCYYSYRKTPPRDRIGALLSRHQLEREIEEMERDRVERVRAALEAYRWRPPPPPYQPAPAYETVMTSDGGSVDWGRPSFPAPSHPPSRPPSF